MEMDLYLMRKFLMIFLFDLSNSDRSPNLYVGMSMSDNMYCFIYSHMYECKCIHKTNTYTFDYCCIRKDVTFFFFPPD